MATNVRPSAETVIVPVALRVGPVLAWSSVSVLPVAIAGTSGAVMVMALMARAEPRSTCNRVPGFSAVHELVSVPSRDITLDVETQSAVKSCLEPVGS
jgi:hypothetical protein